MIFVRRTLDGRGKVDALDTSRPPREPSVADRVERARAKVKELDTKVKRLMTIRKKWTRRLNMWEAPMTASPGYPVGFPLPIVFIQS